MPVAAMPWNQVKTSVKVGLTVPMPPAELPPRRSTAASYGGRDGRKLQLPSRATPAMAAATYETAGMFAVLPFETWDWMHATFLPVSLDCSVNVAMAAISGIWNAMAGTKSAYWAGMACVPAAEKDPSGTINQRHALLRAASQQAGSTR